MSYKDQPVVLGMRTIERLWHSIRGRQALVLWCLLRRLYRVDRVNTESVGNRLCSATPAHRFSG